MSQTILPIRLDRVLLLLVGGLLAVLPLCSQEPEIPTLRGNITAVQPPDGFDVAGYHVTTSAATQFYVLHGPEQDPAKLHRDLRVGTYVHVIGDKDRRTRSIVAREVKIRDEDSSTVSGMAVIDRMITTGTQPAFRADGYVIRLAPDADIRFSGELNSIADVAPGTWVSYDARPDDSGGLIAKRIKFHKPKPHKSKDDPARFAQVTDFPPGSLIDVDGGFTTHLAGHKEEDEGGDCRWGTAGDGWYPVPDVPSVQEHVRRVGMSLIPQYQRDLADDSPEKIRFRFYVVIEKNIRADIACHEGLVLVPVSVINGVQNESQLAAVVADGVAASLERQRVRFINIGAKGFAEIAAIDAAGGGLAAAFVGGALVRHDVERKLEEQRGRVALTLLADAGYDPWQAPEAWRLLAAKEPVKDPAKLKYPDRAGYQLEILGMRYKRAATSTQAAVQAGNSTPNPD